MITGAEVALVGDSFVESASAPLVRALEARAGGAELVPLGRRGWTLRRHLQAADTSERIGRSRYVVACHFGGNDTLLTSEDVRALDAVYRRDGREVVWLAPPIWPAGTPVTGKRDAMRRVLRRSGVRAFGWNARLGLEHLAGDEVHITHAGARRWVEQLRVTEAMRGEGGFSALALVLAIVLAL